MSDQRIGVVDVLFMLFVALVIFVTGAEIYAWYEGTHLFDQVGDASQALAIYHSLHTAVVATDDQFVQAWNDPGQRAIFINAFQRTVWQERLQEWCMLTVGLGVIGLLFKPR